MKGYPHTSFFSVVDRPASRQDFGVRVAGGAVEIPQTVAKVLDRLSVRSPDEFVAYVEMFPTAFAEELHWPLDAVRQARSGLVARLGGVLESDVSVENEQAPAMGARNPFHDHRGRLVDGTTLHGDDPDNPQVVRVEVEVEEG